MTRPSISLRDVAVVLGLAGAMAAEALWFPYDDRVMTGLGWVVLGVTAVPALVRRSHPVTALALSMVMIFFTTGFYPVVQTAPFGGMISGYWLAKKHGRRAAITAGVLLVPCVLYMLGRHGAVKLWTLETPKNLGFVALPLVLGLATRYREQMVAALVERAETAERTREQEALRRVGEERLRIARDIHDVVSHSMVAINVQAGVGAHLIDRDVEQARRNLQDIRQVSAETLTALRSILGVLREDGDDAVAPALSLASVPDLVATLRGAGLDVELDLRTAGADLPSAVDATAYRLVQEALTNVLRHAGTGTATVRILVLGNDIDVEITDRGAGGGAAPLVPSGTGNGLRGMRERVAALGGRFEAGPAAGGPVAGGPVTQGLVTEGLVMKGAGWRVWARLPLTADDSSESGDASTHTKVETSSETTRSTADPVHTNAGGRA